MPTAEHNQSVVVPFEFYERIDSSADWYGGSLAAEFDGGRLRLHISVRSFPFAVAELVHAECN